MNEKDPDSKPGSKKTQKRRGAIRNRRTVPKPVAPQQQAPEPELNEEGEGRPGGRGGEN
jgi:hypothetical protein